ncbi:MAG: DUF4249 domain-containing protein [Bacteroidota bacterium]
MEAPYKEICICLNLLLTFSVSSCLEEFTLQPLEGNDRVLIVEGNIGDTVTSIRLTRTTSLVGDEQIFETNARVILENENGSFSTDLITNGNGEYKREISLNTNEKYKISIFTSDGHEYSSEVLSILTTPPIDSIGWDVINNGLQIHATTNDNINNTRYFRWTFEETWLYSARYNSSLIYENGSLVGRTRDDRIYLCWRTLPSNSIIIGSSIDLSENIIFKQPTNFIDPFGSLKLSRKYSIKVSQQAITKEAFEFWELLKKNSENVGTFFDPQPSQLSSNLTCISDSEIPVIGFISASTTQEARIFINRSDLPIKGIPIHRAGFCMVDTIPPRAEDIAQAFTGGSNLPVSEIYSDFGFLIGYGSAPRGCVDCRLQGGTTTKPDFWEN